MVDREKSNFVKNLIFMLFGFVAVFGLLILIPFIQAEIDNRSNSVTLEKKDSQYLKVISTKEELPDLTLVEKVVEKPKEEKVVIPEVKPIELSQDEVKVVYLGLINNRENYRIVECHISVNNCVVNTNINLNKTGKANLMVNKNYIIRLKISNNKQITFLSIKDN